MTLPPPWNPLLRGFLSRGETPPIQTGPHFPETHFIPINYIVANSDFVSIPMAHFTPGVTTPVDVFVRLADGRHVQVLRAGERVLEERLNNYRARAVEIFWIRRTDLGQLTQQSVTIAGIVVEHPNATLAKKSEFLTQAASSVFREFDMLGLDGTAVESARQVANTVLTLATSEPSWLGLLEELNRIGEEILRHSLAVSVMAPMIAEEMGWHRKDTLEKLALGGLLHDIGMKELDPEILKTPRSELRFEQIRDYESHPLRGAQILALVPKIPEEIVAIVIQHHENAFGLGFPKRLRDVRMHPLARVVAVADTFCEIVMTSPWNNVPKSPDRAVRWIEEGMSQPFNKETFKALKQLVSDSLELPDSSGSGSGWGGRVA